MIFIKLKANFDFYLGIKMGRIPINEKIKLLETNSKFLFEIYFLVTIGKFLLLQKIPKFYYFCLNSCIFLYVHYEFSIQ